MNYFIIQFAYTFWFCFALVSFLNIIYLFLSALDLRCCVWAFSSCSEQAPHCGGFFCCRAWTIQSTGFSSYCWQVPEHGFRSCGTQAQVPLGMWDLLGTVTKTVSLALASGFLTTGPQGSPRLVLHFAIPFNKEIALCIHYFDSVKKITQVNDGYFGSHVTCFPMFRNLVSIRIQWQIRSCFSDGGWLSWGKGKLYSKTSGIWAILSLLIYKHGMYLHLFFFIFLVNIL